MNQAKIIEILEKTPLLTATELFDALGLEDGFRQLETQLFRMTTSGKLKMFNGQYRVVYQGQVAKSKSSPMIGFYDGAELKPYSGRPGAMDAFSKPSLTNGKLVERVAPSGIRAKKYPAEAR